MNMDSKGSRNDSKKMDVELIITKENPTSYIEDNNSEPNASKNVKSPIPLGEAQESFLGTSSMSPGTRELDA